ncbi:MAG: hypothetical protein V1836_03455 [Candidatus Aenigmatarchaeota archaeon]
MKTIKEGLVMLHIPDSANDVFYNPEMEMSRDISVAFLQSIEDKKMSVCDLLSATGARAVRYAKEVDSVERVLANDGNEVAEKYISENASINNVGKKVFASCSGANTFLASHKNEFDFIDIDPFGSPVYYLEEFSRTVKPNSYAAITATDCGALSGVFADTCFRRYGVKLGRTECFKEVGIRNLLGVVASSLASRGFSIKPLLSHVTLHYFRIILEINGGIRNETKRFYHCDKCGYCTFEKADKCGHKPDELGPIWAGKLHDKSACFRILDKLNSGTFGRKTDAKRVLLSIIEEADYPFYYDVHDMSERFSTDTPSMDGIMRKLRSRGFTVTRTHFSDSAIKTNANISDVNGLFGTGVDNKHG